MNYTVPVSLQLLIPPTVEGDECELDKDCPDDMSCGLHGFCVNPCNHVCAVHTGAKCEAKRHRATCWCPNVGQPWKRCFSTQETNGTSTVGHAGAGILSGGVFNEAEILI